MPRIAVGDTELSVDVRGQGPALLLVHGFPLDGRMWRSQIEALATSHKVIVPDLRGFGASPPTLRSNPPEVVSMAQLADDLAALLDVLGVKEPITYCGLSMGGYVGWQFWKRHQRRVARLIQCDTRATADNEATARGRLMLAEQVLREGMEPVVAGMLPRLLAPATQTSRPELVAEVRQMMQSASPVGVAAALRGMAERSDSMSLLETIDVPVLTIVGSEDAISPPDEVRGWTAQIPGARCVEIAGAGHMAPLEAPEHVNRAILDLLDT